MLTLAETDRAFVSCTAAWVRSTDVFQTMYGPSQDRRQNDVVLSEVRTESCGFQAHEAQSVEDGRSAPVLTGCLYLPIR